MANLSVPPNAGESILRSDTGAHHVRNGLIGYYVTYGTLWLTSQRIIFQTALFGNRKAYPLSHVISAVRSNQDIYASVTRHTSTTFHQSLLLTFDNGGKEYFIPKDPDAWAAAVEQARLAAPSLPYTDTPSSRPAVGTNRGLWRMLGIMGGIVLFFICSVFGCFGLSIMVSLLATAPGS